MTGKLTISEVAERHLDLWADQLQRGELQIWQLPLAVQQFISIGWAEAQAISDRQASEYEHRLDLAYLALVHPKDRARELEERLQSHFEAEAEQFFAEPEIPAPALLRREAA